MKRNLQKVLGVLILISFLTVGLSAKAGEYKSLGSGWEKTTAMTSITDKLYITCGGTLYEVTKDGKYKELGSGWDETTAMTSSVDKLYIVCAGTLYKVDIK